jgi:putative two-component system response regulator
MSDDSSMAQTKQIEPPSASADMAGASGAVLVIDDDAGVAAVFERLLARDGFKVITLSDSDAALVNVAFHKPDVVLLDVLMPGLDGFEICRRLRADAATRLIPVILVTALSDRHSRIRGLQAGADDFLSKPIDPEELLTRVRSLVRLKRYTDDLESAASIISTITEMIETRDGYTDGHCYRMANYATALGRRLGLRPDDLQTLHRGGFLHDIGMLAISDTVLSKSGPLEPEEYELIKSHTLVGDRLCSQLRSLQPVRSIVRHHHERHDGTGYPDGLAGDAIPLLAAIVGIVDVFEAVTTQRPYQRAQSLEEAVAVLWRQVDLGWRRRELVAEFAGLVQAGQLDTFRGA